MPTVRYLTAQEAAAQLGVKLPTLYAYVSRGLIRSELSGASHRDRRYRAADVQRLQERRQQRREPDRAAAQALNWGAPLLESALTLIGEAAVYYRGQDVVALAETQTIEAVAGLLWAGELRPPAALLAPPLTPAVRAHWARWLAAGQTQPLIDRFQMVLSAAAAEDPAGYDLRPEAVTRTGGRILRLLTSAAAGEIAAGGVAETLARRWRPSQPAKAARLIDAALILSADHELNISSFTARCVASAGATPYRVVAAGLAALEGFRHGGNVSRMEALLAEAARPAEAGRVLRGWLKRGESVPGFGHALYPAGDPRARALLRHLTAALPRSPAVAAADALAQEAAQQLGEAPNIDFALAALARGLGLAAGHGLALFALGRTVGWIAHALEQYQSNQLIRPRARYIGVLPPAG